MENQNNVRYFGLSSSKIGNSNVINFYKSNYLIIVECWKRRKRILELEVVRV